MAARKAMVTGASGLLGREIVKCLKQEGWDVLGLAYSRVSEGLVKVDLKDPSEIGEIVRKFKPDVVVHSAAERRPDKMEGDLEGSRILNVTSTENIKKLCRESNVFLVYISTDYVFDGSCPPYKPGDGTNPLNEYGKSKRDGEVVVQSYPNSAILRIPILYGNIENIDESAVTTIFKAVKANQPCKLSDYEIRYPTHCADVAVIIERISSTRQSGLWHFSSSESYTKYRMACVMGRAFKIDVSHVEAIKGPTGGAPRPYNTQLECSETFTAFSYQPKLHFEEIIAKILKDYF